MPAPNPPPIMKPGYKQHAESPPAPPCKFVGRELTGLERQAAGLDHVRRWTLCTHPAQPLGPNVCGCKGCGPTCPGYKVDAPESTYAAKPADPPVGVVIGSYKWPELVDLQLKVIRHTCGPVPVLVSSDHPESAAAIDAVCDRHPDVLHLPNVDRIGHTGGDIAALSKGVMWAAGRGVRVLAKLSQRFVITKPRWLQEGAADLLASGLPMAARRCSGKEVFDLRTEAFLVDAQRWNDPAVLKRIRPDRYWNKSERGLSAEAHVFRTLQDLLGGYFYPWTLLPEERYAPTPGFVWHCANQESEYHALAAKFGVKLPVDFHGTGWQGEAAKGEYRFG